MPPRKGIVKSGNAGNSSKAVKPPEQAAAGTLEDKPLFPSGSKYPLSLLNERCQKNEWDKPVVDTRKQGDSFSFIVTLNKTNKKTSQRESVRLEPHPPYTRPTAIEARQWGATYALYRFCNGIQLNRVLPPGPREYWNELAAEHKKAPEHQKWMYEADPFAARKAVDERQAQAAKKKEEASQPSSSAVKGSQPSREFENAPEAKMATSLRAYVEEAIRKAYTLYPEAVEEETSMLSPTDAPQLLKQLEDLGFKAAQAQKAVAGLSEASTLSSSLLRSLTPLQACIEYLILQIPECDLPQRFIPSANSSNPFVTSAHSGAEDLRRRWMEDKAVKECGWPAHVVKECLSGANTSTDWASLVRALNNRLLGNLANAADLHGEETEVVQEDEMESFGARIVDSSQLVIPMPIAPFRLVLIMSPNCTLPTRGTAPPMYILSTSVPAYLRLHLVSKLLLAFRTATLVESGESVVMAALHLLEEEWASVEDNGPPDMSTVLQHMMPRSMEFFAEDEAVSTAAPSTSNRRRGGGRAKDNRSDARVKQDFDELVHSDKYATMLASRQKLPAFQAKDQFLDLLNRNRCVVVVGETGCGKTTQLPQFVLESLIEAGHGASANIIVTQPRRLSAIGVASRVATERSNDGSVGYAIRGESKYDNRTKLLFCTTGVVLRRLGSEDKLQGVTHVIVDEVHERSVDGDFLLLELKELLRSRPNLKVILMSATINHETFVKYFDNAPLLTIPGFTHPVEDKYLEDFLPFLNYRPSAGKPGKKENADEYQRTKLDLLAKGLDEESAYAVQTLSRSDRIDYEIIAGLVQHIIATAPKRGGILIFLPGVQEIRQCLERLRAIGGTRVFPLHANLSSDEQRVVFQSTSDWKIIAATNVAETSITIDDVIYVIDSGKVKETSYDPETGLSKLAEQWVTRAAARQRRGRAGRTQPGVCYKLYTMAQHQKLQPFPIPEIKRVPLESIALTVKVVHNDVKSFLSRAIDPPELAAVDGALSVLEDLAAIKADGELTPLGRQMAMLPVDLRLGKMLILGAIFQCLDAVLTIAASLSGKPLFLSPVDKREEAKKARARFQKGNSDLLTDLNAYNECMRLQLEGKSQSGLRAFCEDNFISATSVREIRSLRQDFHSALSDLGFVPFSTSPSDAQLNRNSDQENVLKAVILGGLWPRVARVVLPSSAIKFDKVQGGTIQRDNTANEYRLYDLRDGRVFLHPASVMFNETSWRSPFAAYFQKQLTTKVFLRDATEVPIYGLLLFGGPVSVNHVGGGLTVGSKNSWIRLKAWPRIGILVNQLRRLLDAQLERCIEQGTTLTVGQGNPILQAMISLLQNDGLTTQIG